MSSLRKTLTESSRYHFFATPKPAVDILIPHLLAKGFTNVWECACGTGSITEVLLDNGFSVFQSDVIKFKSNIYAAHVLDFTKQEVVPDSETDVIITNPPFDLKDEFLERCYSLGIPFALMMPLSALGGKRRISMYNRHGIEILVPDSRINFIYEEDKKRNWFHSAWFCHNILPEKILFTELERTHDTNYNQRRFC